MNKLALTAIMVGGLIQASGCIITTDDDPDPTTGGVLDVTWPVAACNSTTATVYTLNTDTQEMFMDAYACSDGGTLFTTNPIRLELGNYSVWVEIQNADMTRSHAVSLSQTASFTADGQAITIDTVPDPLALGQFELSWTIVDQGSGATLSCGEAGAGGGISALQTLAADSTVSTESLYSCSETNAVSVPMPPGLYTVVVALLNDADEELGNFPAFEETVIGDYIVNLGIFDFTITP